MESRQTVTASKKRMTSGSFSLTLLENVHLAKRQKQSSSAVLSPREDDDDFMVDTENTSFLLQHGAHIEILTNNGCWERAKVTGRLSSRVNEPSQFLVTLSNGEFASVDISNRRWRMTNRSSSTIAMDTTSSAPPNGVNGSSRGSGSTRNDNSAAVWVQGVRHLLEIEPCSSLTALQERKFKQSLINLADMYKDAGEIPPRFNKLNPPNTIVKIISYIFSESINLQDVATRSDCPPWLRNCTHELPQKTASFILVLLYADMYRPKRRDKFLKSFHFPKLGPLSGRTKVEDVRINLYGPSKNKAKTEDQAARNKIRKGLDKCKCLNVKTAPGRKSGCNLKMKLNAVKHAVYHCQDFAQHTSDYVEIHGPSVARTIVPNDSDIEEEETKQRFELTAPYCPHCQHCRNRRVLPETNIISMEDEKETAIVETTTVDLTDKDESARSTASSASQLSASSLKSSLVPSPQNKLLQRAMSPTILMGDEQAQQHNAASLLHNSDVQKRVDDLPKLEKNPELELNSKQMIIDPPGSFPTDPRNTIHFHRSPNNSLNNGPNNGPQGVMANALYNTNGPQRPEQAANFYGQGMLQNQNPNGPHQNAFWGVIEEGFSDEQLHGIFKDENNEQFVPNANTTTTTTTTTTTRVASMERSHRTNIHAHNTSQNNHPIIKTQDPMTTTLDHKMKSTFTFNAANDDNYQQISSHDVTGASTVAYEERHYEHSHDPQVPLFEDLYHEQAEMDSNSFYNLRNLKDEENTARESKIRPRAVGSKDGVGSNDVVGSEPTTGEYKKVGPKSVDGEKGSDSVNSGRQRPLNAITDADECAASTLASFSVQCNEQVQLEKLKSFIQNGDVGKVKEILEDGDIFSENFELCGEDIMKFSIDNNCVDTIRFLGGARSQLLKESSYSYVAHAISQNDDESAQMLRQLNLLGADINQENAQGYSPLHIASMNYNKTLIDLLLQFGADLVVHPKTGETNSHILVSNYDNAPENFEAVFTKIATEKPDQLSYRCNFNFGDIPENFIFTDTVPQGKSLTPQGGGTGTRTKNQRSLSHPTTRGVEGGTPTFSYFPTFSTSSKVSPPSALTRASSSSSSSGHVPLSPSRMKKSKSVVDSKLPLPLSVGDQNSKSQNLNGHKFSKGATPLMIAVFNGDIELVKFLWEFDTEAGSLLERNARRHIRESGELALKIAYQQKHKYPDVWSYLAFKIASTIDENIVNENIVNGTVTEETKKFRIKFPFRRRSSSKQQPTTSTSTSSSSVSCTP